MQFHEFLFGKYARLVHKNHPDIIWTVQMRYYDVDKKMSPMYMMCSEDWPCDSSYAADYVESVYVRVEEVHV